MPSPFSASLNDTVIIGHTGFNAGFSLGFGSGSPRDTLSVALGINKSLSDTAATSESLIPSSGVTGYSVTLGDTITTGSSSFSADFSLAFGRGVPSDVLSAALGISQSLSDTVATASSQFIAAYTLVLPTEIASSSDTLTALAGAFSAAFGDTIASASSQTSLAASTVADTLASSETRTAVGSAAAALGDVLIVSDVVAEVTSPFSYVFSADFGSGLGPANGQLASLTDAVTATDIFTFNTATGLTDSATVADGLTASAGLTTAVLADSLTGVAGPTGLNNALVSLAEPSATVSDSVLLSGTGLTLGDILAAIEALIGTGAASTAVADTLSSSDVTALSASVQALFDTLAASDSVGFLAGYALTLSDSATASEILTPITLILAGSLTDPLVTTETLAGTAIFVPATLADAITTGDNVSPVGYGLVLANSASSADNVSAAGVGIIPYGDSSVTGESTGFLHGYVVGLSDSVVTAESLSSVMAITGVAQADTAATAETLTPAIGARTAVLSDAVTSAEEYNIVTYLGALSDTLTASDTRSAVGTAAVLLADSAAANEAYASLTVLEQTATSEVLTGLGSGFQGFVDVALTGDILLPVRGFVNAWADSLATSDVSPQQNFGYGFVLADNVIDSETWTNVGLGSPLTVTATTIPTGGAVLLMFPGYFPVLPQATHLTISRSIAGSGTWTQIYQGPPVGVFLDIGDGLPKPLSPTTAYLWQAEDYSGTTLIGPLTPTPSFLNQPDQLTQILIRSLQGAINSMILPAGIQRTQISIRMPQNGWQAMPFIVVNLDLIQQTAVAIGEDVINPTPDNTWTLFALAKRVWRVTIMSQDAAERDFYRDTLLAVFRVLKATAFGPLGLDVSHTFQAASYSSTDEYASVTPGFYGADLLLEINGTFPAAVLTAYPVILEIESDPVYQPDVITVDLRPLVN